MLIEPIDRAACAAVDEDEGPTVEVGPFFLLSRPFPITPLPNTANPCRS
jgi:hypothetical protein